MFLDGDEEDEEEVIVDAEEGLRNVDGLEAVPSSLNGIVEAFVL